MNDEFSWALPDGHDEREDQPSVDSPRLAPTPSSREAILAQVGPARTAIYEMVRQSVDEFERVAPWRLLYYPPDDAEAFVAILDALVELIQSLPKQVAAAIGKIPKAAEPSASDEPTREDVRFLFSGIHRMVGRDLKRLEATLAPVRERRAVHADERQLLCELSADLKGKYASSMMGAAASLIAQGLWNGVELEPVLFPEKAEEFRSTRELVDLLKEVLDAIKQLPELVPFHDLLAGWQAGYRVDQYALADLPSLRGKIVKLLKERTRRALYSGDYHQISRREMLLSERINEIEALHQRTWSGTDHAGGQDLAPVFARLGQLTLEMAAVLDVTILKSLLGDKKVDSLRARVTAAKNRPAPTTSRPGDGPDSLIPLLAEDDLRIFLELLLGAVLRRASLTITLKEAHSEREHHAAPEPPPPAPAPVLAEVDDWKLPPPLPEPAPTLSFPAPEPPRPPSVTPKPAPLPEPVAEMWSPSTSSMMDWVPAEPDPEPSPPPPPAPPSPSLPFSTPEAASRPNLRPALKSVSDILNHVLSHSNADLNAFKMAQRLLSKHSRIPVAMLESTHPFLQDVQEQLVPVLRQITPFRGITDEAIQKLEGYCTDLRRPDFRPGQLKDEVPKKMERLLRFLEALRAAVPNL